MLAAGTACSRFSIFSVLVQYGAPERKDNEMHVDEGRASLTSRKVRRLRGTGKHLIFLWTPWIIFMLGKYFQKSGPAGLAESPRRGCLLGYDY